jgi:hypothetical protein
MLALVARRAVWLTIYLLFVLAPVLALLMGDLPTARDFWTEFSSAIAYVGLAMMGLQFGLTARFRYVTEPWGEDVIYHFHRLLSLVALAMVIAHPIILFILDPARLRLLNFFEAPPVAGLIVHICIDCACCDVALARSVKDPLRDMAFHAHPARGGRSRCGDHSYDRVGLLPWRPEETGFVDWVVHLLDLPTALRAHH